MAADGPEHSWVASYGGAGSIGRLLYGGDGLLSFNPAELRDNPVAPPVVLADIRIFKRSLLDPTQAAHVAHEAASSLAALGVTGPLPLVEQLRLTHREAMVSFELRAQHFYNASRLQYAWKLDGFDRDWIVSSEPGQGAVFELLLPRVAPQAVSPQADRDS